VSPIVPRPGSIAFFVSSSGGHYSEVLYIARKFQASAKSMIVTFESTDTYDFTSEFHVTHVPYVRPRKFFGLLRLFPKLNSIVKNNQYDYVASTGAGIAIIGYFLAKANSLPFYFIESFARQESLSLTAKILRVLGLKEFYVQSKSLANHRRVFLSHPIYSFRAEKMNQAKEKRAFKIFVALGTISGFEFHRAVNLTLSIISKGDSIKWQLGSTNAHHLPGISFDKVDKNQFYDLLKWADVVICHGGMGIITECLNLGKIPVVIPRRASENEHVDDHQTEIVNLLERMKLVRNLEKEQSRSIFNDVIKCRVDTNSNI
jgi:UDP-N-acetylglucosamine--N-acetylmuramyl-(pentapeptide) pyrophosphoryl-undecaprenol N-acetylglucosamine transferase